MLRCEIIRSCSHEKVAEAAVISIGSAFCDRVALLASASDMRLGAYVATLVRRFADEATDAENDSLTRVIAGSDMPILAGLRWIVEVMIDGARKDDPRPPARSPSNCAHRPLRAA